MNETFVLVLLLACDRGREPVEASGVDGGGPPATASAPAATASSPGAPAPHTSGLCIRKEPNLPIDEAHGLSPVALPRGLYSVRIDDAPPIEIRPDTGTLVPSFDYSAPHTVQLYKNDKVIATALLTIPSDAPCLGLANYSGSVSVARGRTLESCGCPSR